MPVKLDFMSLNLIARCNPYLGICMRSGCGSLHYLPVLLSDTYNRIDESQ